MSTIAATFRESFLERRFQFAAHGTTLDGSEQSVVALSTTCLVLVQKCDRGAANVRIYL